MDLQLITNWQLRLSIKMEIHQMQIKYQRKPYVGNLNI